MLKLMRMTCSGSLTTTVALLTCLSNLCTGAQALAQPAQTNEPGFDYPELMMTPRSSDRVISEAENERSRSWGIHWPLQVSAASTLAAGLIQSGNNKGESTANTAGILVGSGWLITTFALSRFYHPYESAARELKNLPSQTKRQQLTRERMAEEAIESASRLGKRLTFLSFATNLGTSIYMLTKAKDGSTAEAADIIAAAASTLPFIFQYRWRSVAHSQQLYKKRIYAPVASGGFAPEPRTGSLSPMLTLSLLF